MKKTFCLFLLLALGLSSTALAAGNKPPRSQQILLVEVQNPKDSGATVTGLGLGGNGWQVELPPMPARIGRNGQLPTILSEKAMEEAPLGNILLAQLLAARQLCPQALKCPTATLPSMIFG